MNDTNALLYTICKNTKYILLSMIGKYIISLAQFHLSIPIKRKHQAKAHHRVHASQPKQTEEKKNNKIKTRRSWRARTK